MKKLLYFIFLLGVAFTAKAQNPSFSPSSFTAEDEVTLTIDVTGTNMAGAAETYIWIFSNPDIGGGANGIVNGDWGNSSAAAKMTSAGGNKWTFKFTGTTMFGQSPAQLKSFGFLLKKKDGSAQTPDYKSFFFDPLVFVPSMQRIFPAKVGSDDVVTMNFDRTYAVTVNEQRMSPVSATVSVYDETGTQVGTSLTIPVRVFATTIWAASFIPSVSFTPGAGHKLAKFRYKFNGTILDPAGATVNVSSTESEVIFTTLQ
jgi:hypothetical protein